MTVLHGASRTVLLVGRYAIKLPRIGDGWRPFLWGLLSNMAERERWRCASSVPAHGVSTLKTATPRVFDPAKAAHENADPGTQARPLPPSPHLLAAGTEPSSPTAFSGIPGNRIKSKASRFFAGEHPSHLCPVLLAPPGGWCNVMPRCTPLDGLDVATVATPLREACGFDFKPSSFGLLDGRVVVLNYHGEILPATDAATT